MSAFWSPCAPSRTLRDARRAAGGRGGGGRRRRRRRFDDCSSARRGPNPFATRAVPHLENDSIPSIAPLASLASICRASCVVFFALRTAHCALRAARCALRAARCALPRPLGRSVDLISPKPLLTRHMFPSPNAVPRRRPAPRRQAWRRLRQHDVRRRRASAATSSSQGRQRCGDRGGGTARRRRVFCATATARRVAVRVGSRGARRGRRGAGAVGAALFGMARSRAKTVVNVI